MPQLFFYNAHWPDDKRKGETFDYFAQQIPSGWKELLRDLSMKLYRLGWDGGYYQIKEKFGTLRFYWKNNIKDKELAAIADDVVAYAEDKSGYICDVCGEWGSVRGDLGWILTLCNKHYEERLREVREDD